MSSSPSTSIVWTSSSSLCVLHISAGCAGHHADHFQFDQLVPGINDLYS